MTREAAARANWASDEGEGDERRAMARLGERQPESAGDSVGDTIRQAMGNGLDDGRLGASATGELGGWAHTIRRPGEGGGDSTGERFGG